MNYDYHCQSCDTQWEQSVRLADRDLPTTQPCPHCGTEGAVVRCLAAPSVSYDGGGVVSVVRRAGNGWNDVLNKVKKQSGRKNTIETL